MPTYEYRREDGTTFELMQSMSDEALTKDPDTGQAVVRVLHAPAVHFKGSGFYNTDYGTKRRAREREMEKSSSNGAGKDGSKGGGDAKGSSSDGAAKPPSPKKGDAKKAAASSSSSSSS
jgi:putative FmdB family regulatory protein